MGCFRNTTLSACVCGLLLWKNDVSTGSNIKYSPSNTLNVCTWDDLQRLFPSPHSSTQELRISLRASQHHPTAKNCCHHPVSNPPAQQPSMWGIWKPSVCNSVWLRQTDGTERPGMIKGKTIVHEMVSFWLDGVHSGHNSCQMNENYICLPSRYFSLWLLKTQCAIFSWSKLVPWPHMSHPRKALMRKKKFPWHETTSVDTPEKWPHDRG